MALVGIGAFGDGDPTSTSSLVSSGALEPAEFERVRGLGAVGDLVVHAFDRSGTFVAPEISERAMAISVEQLRSVPRVIAIATGEGKTAAIRGALETGVVSILVTDAAAALGVAQRASGQTRSTAGSRP
jgi:DNA-binding transcriptional regulator LsrR (DeoR family)